MSERVAWYPRLAVVFEEPKGKVCSGTVAAAPVCATAWPAVCPGIVVPVPVPMPVPPVPVPVWPPGCVCAAVSPAAGVW